jgi:hypothetical protein
MKDKAYQHGLRDGQTWDKVYDPHYSYSMPDKDRYRDGYTEGREIFVAAKIRGSNVNKRVLRTY